MNGLLGLLLRSVLALSFFLANQFGLYLARRFGYNEAALE